MLQRSSLALPLFVFTVLFVFFYSVDDRYNVNGFNRYTHERLDQPTTYVTPIPTCETFTNDLCAYPLAIVHDTSAAPTASANLVGDIVAKVLAANPQVAARDVAYFNNSGQINAYLLENPQSILAALHFPADLDLNAPEVTVQYNQT